MALTERQKWDRFIDKHGPVKADAYFWCSGKKWDRRKYCVVLVAHSGHLHCGLELRADTAKELVALMRDAGYRTSEANVAKKCETAGCSPKRFKPKHEEARAITAVDPHL